MRHPRPALRALRRAFLEHRLLLATPASLQGLAQLSESVDAVLPASSLAPLPWFARPPDLAVNLHERGPQSHRVALATTPDALIAFRHPDVPETAAAPEWRGDEHEVDRWDGRRYAPPMRRSVSCWRA